jgi:predicted RNA binding protein YcfA (HicA-like mRNA interferase family)
MPRLRRLSGPDVVSILSEFGFRVVSQRGSHVKLGRQTPEGRQVLTIPAHQELDAGTVRAILRQAGRFVPEEELRQHFYR